MQDLKFAFRQLLKNPGFTAVAVFTLALGIGANTAIFSVVNAVLIRPLPYPAADRILTIQTIHQRDGRSDRWEAVFDPDFKAWSEQNKVFDYLAAYGNRQTTLISGGEPERRPSSEVTRDFFALLGVRPLLGRTFVTEEHQTGGPRVVVLGEKLWRERFRANPFVVGQAVTIDGRNATVVGVLPKTFKFKADCDLWTPLVLDTSRRNAYHEALARLRPGVTPTQAQAEMDGITRRLAEEFSDPGLGVSLGSLQEQIVGGTRRLLFVFLGAVGFVLLIACANVTNLLLARATARQREIQIRTALGAGRAHLIRQLLTESMLLAFAGGVLGLLLAIWGLNILVALMPPNLVPRIHEVGLDVRVLGFNFALCLFTGVAFGLLPAYQASRANANEALKERGRNQSAGVRHGFLRQALVAAQIAVSIVLLIGAGLMLKSFVRLSEVELGFRPEHTLTLNLSLPDAGYSDPARIKAFYREVLGHVRALPGVRAAGFASAVPLGGGGVRIYGDFVAEGRPASQTSWTSKIVASPEYFQALGVPLLSGRTFTDDDDDDRTQAVAIVSGNMAHRLWPGEDPLGKRVQFGVGGNKQPWLQVVGVVGEVRQDDLRAEPPSGIYMPYQQVSQVFLINTTTLVIRGVEEPRGLAAAVRKTIQAVDPTLPVFDIHTMDELVSFKIAPPRFNTWLLVSFSVIALVLAVVGIYGVVSYGVSQRTQEIGIRLALGARSDQVVRMVVGQGMKAVFVGVGCGVVAAVALTRFLAAQLYSVTPSDPATFAGVVTLFIGVAAGACLIPSRHASRVDPMEALRND